MARSRVANGGSGLRIWRVAANISNTQSWTPDKGWSSSLGVGRGAKIPHKLLLNVTQGIGIGPVAGFGVHGNMKHRVPLNADRFVTE
jgi:hypothetical protein